MTTAIATQPMTTAAFFFGDNHDSIDFFDLVNGDQVSIDALADALEEQGSLRSISAAVKTLSHAGLGAVGSQIATAAHSLLGLDLGDLVVAGWCKFSDLTVAAKRTIAAPGSAEVVELAAHCITWTHSPQVEVLVNETRVATVRFDLSMRFKVKALVATVRDGYLVRLNSGGCDVTGTLAAQGRQLAKREAHFQLPLLLRLGDGIPLLRSGARSATAISLPAA